MVDILRYGICISEAIQLKEGDIDFQRGTLTIVHLKEGNLTSVDECSI